MARTTEAVAGFFHTRAQGEAAYQALIDDGFTRDELGFLCSDTRGHDMPKVGPVESIGAESEAPRDAWVGGAIGLAAGVVAMAIPGIGPALAIGPLAGAIGGLGAGVATGGVIGLLKDHGISEEEAQFYAKGVSRGGALVTVHGVPEDRAGKARDILKRQGALDTEDLNT
jgi:hypothetical protein